MVGTGKWKYLRPLLQRFHAGRHGQVTYTFPKSGDIQQALLNLLDETDGALIPTETYKLLADRLGISEEVRNVTRGDVWRSGRDGTNSQEKAWHTLVQTAVELLRRKGRLTRNTPGLWTATTVTASQDDIQIMVEALEGAVKYRLSAERVRNTALYKAKIRLTASNGPICCEGCNQDYCSIYGEIGQDIWHVHHNNPLGTGAARVTKLDDLAVLCPNCHAIVHKHEPILSVEELRHLISNVKSRLSGQ